MELAVLSTDRSAEAATTRTVTVEVLLFGLGSGVVEDTVAVLEMLPVALSLTVPRMRMVSDVSATTVPRLSVPVHGRKAVSYTHLPTI